MLGASKSGGELMQDIDMKEKEKEQLKEKEARQLAMKYFNEFQ